MKIAFRQMCIPGWLQAYLILPAVLASEVGHTGKTLNHKRLAPDSLIYPVQSTLPRVFLGRCFSVRMSEVLIFLFSSAVTTPHHRYLGVHVDGDLLAFVGSLLTFWGSGSLRRVY